MSTYQWRIGAERLRYLIGSGTTCVSAQSSWKEILNELQVCMYAGAKRIGQRKVAPRHRRNPCAGYRLEKHNQQSILDCLKINHKTDERDKTGTE